MRNTTFDAVKVERMLIHALQSGLVLVHVSADGEIDGGFVGIITERWYAPERILADLGLFVRPDRRGGLVAYKLLQAVLAWAKENHFRPEDVQLAISTGVKPDETGRLFEQMGFNRVGGLYQLGSY